MLTFMFWNIRGNDLSDLLSVACHQYNVDILVLAECQLATATMLPKINAGASALYFEPANNSAKLKFYSRLPLNSFSSLYDGDRSSIRLIKPPIGSELILASAHFTDKRYAKSSDHEIELDELLDQVHKYESHLGHTNTLIIGDLNMNPFEKPMIAANGFHAVMDKRIAQKIGRNLKGRRWDFFYNPMWSRLGDDSAGPPGTYFYSKAGAETHYWNTFDQILMRPALLPNYTPGNLQVVTSIGTASLLKRDRINTAYSDHLPLLISL